MMKQIAKMLNPSKTRKQQFTQIYVHIFGQNPEKQKKQLIDAILQKIYENIKTILQKYESSIFQKKQQAIQAITKQLEHDLNLFKPRKDISQYSEKILNSYLEQNQSSQYRDSSSKDECMLVQFKPSKSGKQQVRNIWDTSQNTWKECLCPQAPTILHQPKNFEYCYRCGKQCHVDCFWAKQNNEPFECPFCFIINCTPQKNVSQVIFAGYLPYIKKQKVQYKIKCEINKVKQKIKQGFYLQARCVKFNSKNRYEISWPDCGNLSVNRVKISEFKPLNSNSPLKRRNDEPIRLNKIKDGIYDICIEEKSCSQTSYKTNKRCHHLFMILLVRDYEQDQLTNLLQQNILSVSDSRATLKHYLNHETDGLTIQKISISLKCQYFCEKMKLPARSMMCSTHFQPFDLKSMIALSLNSKSSSKKWKCPICDKRAYHIQVDQYILNIIMNNPNAMQVIFRKDGEIQIGQEQNQLKKNNETLIQQRKNSSDKKLDSVNDYIEIGQSEVSGIAQNDEINQSIQILSLDQRVQYKQSQIFQSISQRQQGSNISQGTQRKKIKPKKQNCNDILAREHIQIDLLQSSNDNHQSNSIEVDSQLLSQLQDNQDQNLMQNVFIKNERNIKNCPRKINNSLFEQLQQDSKCEQVGLYQNLIEISSQSKQELQGSRDIETELALKIQKAHQLIDKEISCDEITEIENQFFCDVYEKLSSKIQMFS